MSKSNQISDLPVVTVYHHVQTTCPDRVHLRVTATLEDNSYPATAGRDCDRGETPTHTFGLCHDRREKLDFWLPWKSQHSPHIQGRLAGRCFALYLGHHSAQLCCHQIPYCWFCSHSGAATNVKHWNFSRWRCITQYGQYGYSETELSLLKIEKSGVPDLNWCKTIGWFLLEIDIHFH